MSEDVDLCRVSADMPNKNTPRGFAALKWAIVAGIAIAIASNEAWYFATRRCTDECRELANQLEEMRYVRQIEQEKARIEQEQTRVLMEKVKSLADYAKHHKPAAQYTQIMDAIALYVQQGHAPPEVAAEFMRLLETPPTNPKQE